MPVAVAPALSVVGLVVVAAVSWALLGGSLPNVAGPGGPNGPGGPIRTPTPSNVVIVDPRANVPGTLLYAKDGNIWTQSGDAAKQITDNGNDSMPTWSPDGSAVYFIRNTRASGDPKWITNGEVRFYNLTYPSLMQVPAAGGDTRQRVKGQVRNGAYTWSYFTFVNDRVE